MNILKKTSLLGLIVVIALGNQAYAQREYLQVDGLTPQQVKKLKQLGYPSGQNVNVLFEFKVDAILTQDQQMQLRTLRSKKK